MGSAEKFAEQYMIGNIWEEVYMQWSNCTNGVVRSRDAEA